MQKMTSFSLQKLILFRELTWHHDEELCENDDAKQGNKKYLSFVVLPQRFKRCFNHETLDIFRFFQHVSKFNFLRFWEVSLFSLSLF